MVIRSDRGEEFTNESFVEYCEKKGIKCQVSAPRTPQQNGVRERRNMSLMEMARIPVNDQNFPHKFWAKAINTTCNICNRCLVRPLFGEICYELSLGKISSIFNFKLFGSKCYILNIKDQLGKFDSKNQNEILLGYSLK